MNIVIVPMKHRHVYNQQGLPVWWAWCLKTFGSPNNCQYGKPASEHYWRLEPGSGYVMWFSDPAHATLFMLRWS